MRDPSMLKKQQVGLRLPGYLIQEIEGLARQYDLNRSEIIIEAIRSYVEEQKASAFYADFDQAAKELKTRLTSNGKEKTLGELIGELENNQPEQL